MVSYGRGKVALFCTYVALLTIFALFRQNILNYVGQQNSEESTVPPDKPEGKKGPPVVVKPFGGLGNQLFEYAAAYTIANENDLDLITCVPRDWNKTESVFSLNKRDRSFGLHLFNIPKKNWIFIGDNECGSAVDNDTSSEYGLIMEEYLFEDKPLAKKGILQYNLWTTMQSEVYFESRKMEILEMFTPKSDSNYMKFLPGIINKFKLNSSNTESVSVHIRRGDFAHSDDYRVLPLSYYKNAMKLICNKLWDKNLTFFVFSDDIASVKSDFERENLGQLYNVVFVSNKKLSRIIDFILMSLCKHNIISNGTFAWWAAYVNRNLAKFVVAPLPKFEEQWFANRNIAKEHILWKIDAGGLAYPADWITLDPFNT